MVRHRVHSTPVTLWLQATAADAFHDGRKGIVLYLPLLGMPFSNEELALNKTRDTKVLYIVFAQSAS